ncbi:MAG: hypothetical protein ABI650_03665 [Dokdonella sp.]
MQPTAPPMREFPTASGKKRSNGTTLARGIPGDRLCRTLNAGWKAGPDEANDHHSVVTPLSADPFAWMELLMAISDIAWPNRSGTFRRTLLQRVNRRHPSAKGCVIFISVFTNRAGAVFGPALAIEERASVALRAPKRSLRSL